MRPSHQRFEASDAAGLQIDQRLIIRPQHIVLDRGAQIDFGPAGNTLIGVIGGGITLLLLDVTGLLLIPPTLSATLAGILGVACGSMMGGATLLAIVGLIKYAVVNKTAIESILSEQGCNTRQG